RWPWPYVASSPSTLRHSMRYPADPAPSGRCPMRKTRISTRSIAFERTTSKRRKGYPSESRVKRGRQIVHGDKELEEKLGRNDPVPGGSSRRFQELLHAQRFLRRLTATLLLSESRGCP